MAISEPKYLAGLFDGEGWISLRYYKPSYSKQVGLGMTHLIVRDFKDLFGGTFYIEPQTKRHRKTYRWALSGKKGIKRFLERIFPHLVVKRAQAAIMLTYLRGCKGTRGKKMTCRQKRLFNTVMKKLRRLNSR